MNNHKILINGKMCFGDDSLLIKSPLNNEVVGSVPALKESDIDKAFLAADEAFFKWSNLNYEKRINFILDFKKILLEKKEYLANNMMNEIAKNFKDCIVEIERSCEYIDETIKNYLENFVESTKVDESITKIKGKIGYFKRVPVGVVLAISPFNYPINLSISKIIPALLVGDTVVFKPATQGSISGAILSDFFYKAKFPPGTINVITGKGSEIGDYLLQNKRAKVITFTGSPEIGNKIRKSRGDANLILELGGKDPAIIDENCDIDHAVNEIVNGAFNFSGQRCTAIKVVYADIENEEKILKKLKSKIATLKVGFPGDNVDIVPLINNSSLKYALELIDDAKSKKSKIIIGGQSDNNFLFPTLIKCSTLNTRIMNEEQFSPIIPIYFYEKKKLKKIIENINSSNYGLQASIFSNSKEFFWKVADQLDVGTINWNKASSRGPDIFPFIGVRDSGQGVQGIYYALESMTRIKGFVENF